MAIYIPNHSSTSKNAAPVQTVNENSAIKRIDEIAAAILVYRNERNFDAIAVLTEERKQLMDYLWH